MSKLTQIIEIESGSTDIQSKKIIINFDRQRSNDRYQLITTAESNMKSTPNRCLYRLIALPLLISIVSIAGLANATTKSKSKSTAKVPAALELNRLTPVAAGQIDPSRRNRDRNGREILPPAPIIEPFWAHPKGIADIETVPAPKKSANKSQPSLKSKQVSTKPQTTSLTLVANTDRPAKPKPIEKKLVLAPKIDLKTPAVAKSKIILAPKIEISTSAESETSTTKTKPNLPKHIAANSQTAFGSNYLRLVRNPHKGTNALGNPIYTLEAYVNGQKYRSFDAVSGTATTQNLDRNVGDSAAPLPNGTYSVNDRIIGGMTAEVGKTFISIIPRFETERSELGIHLDPSFNKTNGYDGTAGCIGMTTATDRDAINDFVLKYRPRNLFVKIAR